MVGQHYKAIANERKYPNIVELAVPADGLQIELSRRIIQFHKLRHIQPRHGRRIVRGNRIYSRWCFADLGKAPIITLIGSYAVRCPRTSSRSDRAASTEQLIKVGSPRLAS